MEANNTKFIIEATYSIEGCKKLLSMGGKKRIELLKATYGYLELELLDYFWLDAGKKVILIIQCNDGHKRDILSALKMSVYTSGLFSNMSVKQAYSSEDIENIKHIIKVID